MEVGIIYIEGVVNNNVQVKFTKFENLIKNAGKKNGEKGPLLSFLFNGHELDRFKLWNLYLSSRGCAWSSLSEQ